MRSKETWDHQKRPYFLVEGHNNRCGEKNIILLHAKSRCKGTSTRAVTASIIAHNNRVLLKGQITRNERKILARKKSALV